MQRREYLVATCGVVAGTALAGCTGGATGTLATQVTNQPGDITDSKYRSGDISDFESCVVTITEIRIEPASEGEEGEDDPDAEESYDVEDVEVDLVELQDGSTEFVGEEEAETGEYGYLKLAVSTVSATLEDGNDAEVSTPGDAPLTFDLSFEILEDGQTELTADFTPVKQGQSGGYVLQPVADGTTVEYDGARE